METVERAGEFADEMLLARDDTARGLGHVDIFKEMAVEEGRDHVHLKKRPTVVSGNGNQVPNRFPANCRSKSFLIVDAMNLFIAPSDNAGFVDGWRGRMGFGFEFENPSGCNGPDAGGKGNEIPGRVFNNRLVFSSHGGKPRGMAQGVREGDGLSAFFDTVDQRFDRIQRKVVIKFLRGNLGTRRMVEGGRGAGGGGDGGGLEGGDVGAGGLGLSGREGGVEQDGGDR